MEAPSYIAVSKQIVPNTAAVGVQAVAVSPCSIRRIIQLTVPVQFAEVRLTDQNGKDVTQTSMYSWSSDGLCWTGWVSYQQYLQLARSIESDFFLRILIFSSIGTLWIGGMATQCFTVCLDSTNQFLLDFCGSQNLFSPYSGLDCALQLQQQLSDTVVCIIGIPAYYFRVSPDADTADWTFKEYILHSVESVKYVKLVCEDGALPSSKPQMSEFDFDWENDWEVEMSKTAFAAAFGDTAFPKQRDLVYVPMMKRMYEVNSAYDEKNEGLMWRSTTWKLALVKYNEKDNVSHGSYEELIDTLVENEYMEVFKPVEENEQYRQSGEPQTEQPLAAENNLYSLFVSDGIRMGYTKESIDIVERQVNHGSTVVCRNAYLGKTQDASVVYQKKRCGDNGTILVEMHVPSIEETLRRLNIDTRDEDFPTVYTELVSSGELTLGCGVQIEKTGSGSSARIEGSVVLDFCGNQARLDIGQEKDYIVVLKWNRRNCTSEMEVYENVCRSEELVVRLRRSNWRFDFTNPVTTSAAPYNEDLSTSCGVEVSICPYPVELGYFKMFNTVLDGQRTAEESVKYTTTVDDCVINDVARPVFGDRGYNVR